MKTAILKFQVCALALMLSLACTNNNRSGSSMSGEGTVQSNGVNSDKEDDRISAGADSTGMSPGSNAIDNMKGTPASQRANNPQTPAATGTGHDPNMAGQSDTHGKKTTAGDK